MKRGDLVRSKTEGYYGIVFDAAGGSVSVFRSNGLFATGDQNSWEDVVHETGGMAGQPVNFAELVDTLIWTKTITTGRLAEDLARGD